MKSLNKFNWKSLNKYTSAKAAGDLNNFLEKLPQNVNKSMLIVAAVVWSVAGALGLYTTVKMQEFSNLSLEREEAKALLPIVPVIQERPINASRVKSFVDELQETYKGLEIKGNSSNIIISAKSTSAFGEFREAIGHVQNGGQGWRVNVDKLCVGRECMQNPLSASLRVNTISVQKAPSN